MKEACSPLVGEPGINRGGANVPVSEVVLDKLEGHSGVEQVRRDRVPQGVRRQMSRKTGPVAVSDKTGLDLPAAKRTFVPSEERSRACRLSREVQLKECAAAGEKRPLRPVAALQAPDEDPVAVEVDVLALEERDFPDTQTIEVHHGEERPIARIVDRAKEEPQLGLGQIPRRAQRVKRWGRQGGKGEG